MIALALPAHQVEPERAVVFGIVLGVISFVVMAWFVNLLAAFLTLLPQEHDGLKLRHALEPRHETFRDDGFFDLCREHDVAVVFGDDDEFPCIDADTASFRYVRLQRMHEEVPTGYDDAALDAFAERTKGWIANGEDAYIFMINGAKVRAPAAAAALQQRLLV